MLIKARREPCGSGFTRDYDSGCTTAIAGKPAPTVTVSVIKLVAGREPCGSGFTRDYDSGLTTAIAGKPAPTVTVSVINL